MPNINALTQILPELSALQTIVEQSDWHNDDPFQQTVRLFNWIRQPPASLFESINAPEDRLQSLLNAVVDPESGHYTVQELLAFAALIHDVGKAKTFRRLPDGTTQCPGHEVVGARLAPVMCARFDFTLEETGFITNLVGAHGEPYALFKKVATLPVPQQQEQIRCFEEEHAAHLLPLLLLAWGDLVTSHLQARHPKKYKAILNFYWRRLQSVWPTTDREE